MGTTLIQAPVACPVQPGAWPAMPPISAMNAIMGIPSLKPLIKPPQPKNALSATQNVLPAKSIPMNVHPALMGLNFEDGNVSTRTKLATHIP